MRYEIFIKKIRNFDCVLTMQSVITGNFFQNFQIAHFGEKKYDADWHLHAAASETCYSHWHSLQCRTALLCRSSGNYLLQRSNAIWHYQVPFGTPMQ